MFDFWGLVVASIFRVVQKGNAVLLALDLNFTRFLVERSVLSNPSRTAAVIGITVKAVAFANAFFLRRRDLHKVLGIACVNYPLIARHSE